MFLRRLVFLMCSFGEISSVIEFKKIAAVHVSSD